jgi:hypothetical protein
LLLLPWGVVHYFETVLLFVIQIVHIGLKLLKKSLLFRFNEEI